MSSGLGTSLDQRTFAHHIQGKGPLFGLYNGLELLGLVGGDLNNKKIGLVGGDLKLSVDTLNHRGVRVVFGKKLPNGATATRATCHRCVRTER